MEIAQLRALREVGERGSIAAVAAAHLVTPSSISQQLSALQRESTAPLTEKRGRRTVLTAAGQALADAAIDVEVALARARETLTESSPATTDRVSVAAFHSAGLALFGPLIASLRGSDAPALVLGDFDVAQTEFPSLTADHDLVVAHRLTGSPEWPGWVRTHPLFFEPLDVAVRRDHPLARGAVVEPSQLRGAPWVAVHEGYPLEQAIRVIATLSGEAAQVSHRINDFAVAASVVASSDCVALLPRHTTDLRPHPDVVLRPLGVPGVGRQVDCLTRPEATERRHVQTVLERIRQIAGDLTS